MRKMPWQKPPSYLKQHQPDVLAEFEAIGQTVSFD
jgi:hypothetical protein